MTFLNGLRSFFLKQKLEVLAILQKFKTMVKKETDCHIKRLRIDGDTKYTLRNFNVFCEKEGVQH